MWWGYFFLLVATYSTNVLVLASTNSLTDKKQFYPLLRYTDTRQNVVDWSDAVGVEKLTSCSLIRITRRGIRCVPSNWVSLLDKDTKSDVKKWVLNPCKVSDDALCLLESTHSGEIYNSLVFPYSESLATIHETERVSVNLDTSQYHLPSASSMKAVYDDNMVMQIPDLLRARPCQHGVSRKVLHGPGRRYDVTACDLFDTNVDFVYMPSSHMLLIQMLDHGYIEYGITSVLVLVIIVFIAEELAHEVMSNRSGINTPTTSRMLLMISTWCALLVMSIMLQFTSHRAHEIVTEQDSYNLYGLFAYILMYTFFWVWDMLMLFPFVNIIGTGLGSTNAFGTGHSRNHGINSMLATTFFAIQVLTGSADNIYSQPFFFVFLYRMLYKTYSIIVHVDSTAYHHPHNFVLLDRVIVTADIVFLMLFFECSFLPAYAHYTEALLRASTFFLIANVIALVIIRNERHASKTD
jgi:uncharacterized membrane protein YecN with MAPEG domain